MTVRGPPIDVARIASGLRALADEFERDCHRRARLVATLREWAELLVTAEYDGPEDETVVADPIPPIG